VKIRKVKNQWPLAQVREDGMPAVWLTHTMWTILRHNLVREYCSRREARGRHNARFQLNALDDFSDNFLSLFCEHDSEKAAMELYKIGSDAYFKPEHAKEYNHVSTAGLVELGDKWQACGYKDEFNKITKADNVNVELQTRRAA
jgi:hypothetical protein